MNADFDAGEFADKTSPAALRINRNVTADFVSFAGELIANFNAAQFSVYGIEADNFGVSFELPSHAEAVNRRIGDKIRALNVLS